MRAIGIPARIVTGYQGAERNGIDDFWVVRQSDAHAWTEVWLGAQGWVRVDPTGAVAPGRTGTLQRLRLPRGVIATAIDAVSPGFAFNVRAMWDAVNNNWNQWVLNYTQSKQLSLLRDIGFESPSWEDLGLLLIACIVVASLAGAAWTLWEKRRHDPWLRLLDGARARLRRAGMPLPSSATPREMAANLAHHRDAQDPRVQENCTWLLRLEVLRYAPQQAGAGNSEFKRLRRELKRLAWPK